LYFCNENRKKEVMTTMTKEQAMEKFMLAKKQARMY